MVVWVSCDRAKTSAAVTKFIICRLIKCDPVTENGLLLEMKMEYHVQERQMQDRIKLLLAFLNLPLLFLVAPTNRIRRLLCLIHFELLNERVILHGDLTSQLPCDVEIVAHQERSHLLLLKIIFAVFIDIYQRVGSLSIGDLSSHGFFHHDFLDL